MSKILDNLFLGSYQDARNQNFLNRNNITHIVTVGAELKTLYPRNYKYLYVAALDTPSYRLSTHFHQIADFINNAIENEQGKVFVHCYAGISRSTTSVLCYLMKYHGMGLQEGRSFVRSKRSIICPNPGFVQQLTTFQKSCNIEIKKSEPKTVVSQLNATTTSLSRSWAGMTGSTGATGSTSSIGNLTRFGKSAFGFNNSTLSVSGVNGVTSNRTGTTTTTTANSTTVVYNKSSEEKKEETISLQPKFDYFCRNCGIKLFASDIIVHNTGRTFNAHCNAIYVENLPFGGSHPKSGFSKVSCPNSKCLNTIGFSNLKGGRCGCNKDIGNVWGIYPLRITYAKVKA